MEYPLLSLNVYTVLSLVLSSLNLEVLYCSSTEEGRTLLLLLVLILFVFPDTPHKTLGCRVSFVTNKIQYHLDCSCRSC